MIAIQVGGLLKSDLKVNLYDLLGQKIASTSIFSGQTIAFFDTQTLYDGFYIVSIENKKNIYNKKILIKRD